MNKRVLIVIVLAGFIAGFTSQCVKVPKGGELPIPEGVLVVPPNFNWKTVKEINSVVNVISVDGIEDNMVRIIKIFKDAAMSDSQLIATGAAKPGSPFKTTISLATSIPTLYFQEILPDGARNVKSMDVTGNNMVVSFSNSISAQTKSANASQNSAQPPTAPIKMNAPIDKDADGVPDGTDIDDNDATVAFASYFPSAGGWGTYAFEDMWPELGDYDVNDMVLGFRVTYFSNAANLVTKIRLDYNLRAAGSTYSIGTAFQLDRVQASNVISVTGRTLNGSAPFATNANGTEVGVSLAVIPIVNNLQDPLSFPHFLNTVNSNHRETSNNYLDVKFTTPVLPADLSMAAFNLFIVANSREREVHLPSYSGTSKFNASLASGHNVSPTDNFKTNQGMMWAIMLPEYFKYPSERNSIIKAYTRFTAWATSGGVTNTDWYSSLVGGNLDMQYIYLANPQTISTPVVTTGVISDIATNSATATGQVVNDGGASVFARGFCWKNSTGPTISDSKTNNGAGTGGFTGYITGLTPGTYYVRAYATNEIGTSYGEEKSFVIAAIPAPQYPGTALLSVKIGGVWWAPVNAGYAPDRLYGLLYQWGRMYGQRGSGDDGGSYSNADGPVTAQVGNLSSNANTFYRGFADWCTQPVSAWNIASYNPCPSGWRVPTGTELDALVTIGSSWVDANSGGVDNLSGRWFGSDHASTRTNSVFLPTGGFRSIGGTLSGSGRGTAGYYWPSNSEPSNSVLNLYITQTNPGQRFTRDKVNGYSVRCVTE